MATIIIRNVGPIRRVELELNRVNVFMGPQSCGKSTIAKIISYCSWYEKNYILKTQTMTKSFWDELIEFHNLEEGYFSEDSYIEYTTECFHLVAQGTDKLNVEDTSGPEHIFRNRKIEYIPAERNFVTLPGIGKYNDTRDNVLNFLYDWFQAKQEISREARYDLPLPSLDAAFFYDRSNDADYIVLEEGKQIRLRHASSGLMSVTPLLVVFNYMLHGIYAKEKTKTPLEIVNREQRLARILRSEEARKQAELLGNEMLELQKNVEVLIENNPEQARMKLYTLNERLNNILGYYSEYAFSDIIIEEPELNLFPRTQRDLVYYMMRQIQSSEKGHILTLTTHSPYILFALNNCMMGGLVGAEVPDEEKKEVPSAQAWIDPRKVSVYEIQEGVIRRIQDEDGIIEDNYLNQAYKDITAEYLSLLNHYEGN